MPGPRADRAGRLRLRRTVLSRPAHRRRPRVRVPGRDHHLAPAPGGVPAAVSRPGGVRLAGGAGRRRRRGGHHLHARRLPRRTDPAGAAAGPRRDLRQAVRARRPVRARHGAARPRSRPPAHRLPESSLGLGLPYRSRALPDRARSGPRPASSRGSSASAPDPGPSPSGGGALRDFGSHLVDQALVLGPARSAVSMRRCTPTNAAGLDDDVFVAITHERGGLSHVWGSWGKARRAPASGPTAPPAPTSWRPEMDSQEGRLGRGAPGNPAGRGRAAGALGTRVPRRRRQPLASEPGRGISLPRLRPAVRGPPVPVDPKDAVATAAGCSTRPGSARGPVQVVRRHHELVDRGPPRVRDRRGHRSARPETLGKVTPVSASQACQRRAARRSSWLFLT